LDFLLLGRPILFYMPDLERYLLKRGFYFDPLLLPGTITRSQASLVEVLKRLLTAPRPLPSDSRVDAFRSSVWGSYDGHAASAVASELRRDIDRRLARDTQDRRLRQSLSRDRMSITSRLRENTRRKRVREMNRNY
jgi:hypothetical protein